jgi:ribosomal protein S18 acetylase RimI-like enzyme
MAGSSPQSNGGLVIGDDDDDDDYEYHTLHTSHIAECALVMAKAFCNSPSYRYILQYKLDEKDRIACLQWMFTLNMQLLLRKHPAALRGMIHVPTQTVVACFFLTPNPFQKMSAWEMITGGLWQVPFRFGFGTYQKLMQVLDDVRDEAARLYDQKEDFVTLERMVVLPEYQGNGLGTKALQAALRQTTLEVRLSTQEERNTQFYKRLGFEIVGEKEFYPDNKEFGFHSWMMIRREQEKRTESSL